MSDVTRAPFTVTRARLVAKSTVRSRVNVVGPPATVCVMHEPLAVHVMVYQLAATSTGSEKVTTMMFASTATVARTQASSHSRSARRRFRSADFGAAISESRLLLSVSTAPPDCGTQRSCWSARRPVSSRCSLQCHRSQRSRRSRRQRTRHAQQRGVVQRVLPATAPIAVVPMRLGRRELRCRAPAASWSR